MATRFSATGSVVAIAPYVLNFNVDYVKDLVPVIEVIQTIQVLAVHPSLGVGTVAELIAVARQKPGIGYATSGVGTQQHFIGEWFAQLAGIKLEHVPYRGAGQAINDLIAGHVLIGLMGPTAVIPHRKAGTVRIIAQSAQERSPSLPDVPTFEEAGVNGLVLEEWMGVFAPPGIPSNIVARLNTEINKVLLNKAVVERLLEGVEEPVGGPPERLAKIMQQDSAKYARLAKELKIKAE
jgi:tripartite-type tricarboxylate transporter receptor subunit TctC